MAPTPWEINMAWERKHVVKISALTSVEGAPHQGSILHGKLLANKVRVLLIFGWQRPSTTPECLTKLKRHIIRFSIYFTVGTEAPLI